MGLRNGQARGPCQGGSPVSTPHPARFYQALTGTDVLCTLCPHDCHIHDGGRGACGVRYNAGGTLYTLVYDRVISRHTDPIEKKPLFHFHPGSAAYSVATVGCNLRCSFCQNWEISQWPKGHLPKRLEGTTEAQSTEPICPALGDLGERVLGEEVTPAGVVAAAEGSGARSLAYTYTEPTIFYELAHDTATLARQRGLKNLFVTNGFIGEAAQREIGELLDAANVDLKFFRDESYRRISRAPLQPILEAIRRYHEVGVWLEVTTLIIPGVNDSAGELADIAAFLADLDPAIPWHISRFYPAWKMRDYPPTPTATLERAAEIGRQAGLRYIYAGNVPGISGEDTYCPACGAWLIDRYGFYIRENRIHQGRCPDCGEVIDGVAMDG